MKTLPTTSRTTIKTPATPAVTMTPAPAGATAAIVARAGMTTWTMGRRTTNGRHRSAADAPVPARPPAAADAPGGADGARPPGGSLAGAQAVRSQPPLADPLRAGT